MAQPPRSHAWRWTLRVLMLLAGLVGSLFALEWALGTWNLLGVNHPSEINRYRLQMWDFEIKGVEDADLLDGLLFMHRPRGRQTFGDFTVSVNGLGFRGPEARLTVQLRQRDRVFG